MKKNTFYMGLVLVTLAACLFLINKKMDSIEKMEAQRESNVSFNIKLLKEINKNNESNYLFSPYSVEIALSILREGSTGNSHREIAAVAPARSIKYINIANRVSVANALFIKNAYANDIKKTYISDIKANYNADVIYDDFNTPDQINKWVDKKTDHMIDKILDSMNPNFIIGIANALAIDVEWKDSFECNRTSKEVFNAPNGKINVEGMHSTLENAEYIMNDDVKGIVLPYKTYKDTKGEEVNFEFIALLPEKKLSNFVDELGDDDLLEIINSKKSLGKNEKIRLMLPRFEYDYKVDNFIGVLNNLGIKKVFTNEAELKNITNIDSYVGEAVHKTHISLNETGTKAAAVTYFGVLFKSAMPSEEKYIDIEFNKPFLYIIRDKDSNEVLFIGSVYSPNKWTGSTCESED